MEWDLFADEMHPGMTFKSPGKTLTDAHFLFFAGLSGDNHPIHYDQEYAQKRGTGQRLAHGLLLASLTALGASAINSRLERSMIAFLEQSTTFLAPATIGDTITPHFEVLTVEPKSRSRALVTLRTTLLNQRGETVLEGRHKYLLWARGAAE